METIKDYNFDDGYSAGYGEALDELIKETDKIKKANEELQIAVDKAKKSVDELRKTVKCYFCDKISVGWVYTTEDGKITIKVPVCKEHRGDN